jgi:hypothetical protein
MRFKASYEADRSRGVLYLPDGTKVKQWSREGALNGKTFVSVLSPAPGSRYKVGQRLYLTLGRLKT